jgi:hypothetical protein
MEKEIFESKNRLIDFWKHEIFSRGQSIIYSWENTDKSTTYEKKIYDVQIMKLIKERNEIDLKISNRIDGFIGYKPDAVSDFNKQELKKVKWVYFLLKLCYIILVYPIGFAALIGIPIAIHISLDDYFTPNAFKSILKFVLIIIVHPLLCYFLMVKGFKRLERNISHYKEIVREYNETFH